MEKLKNYFKGFKGGRYQLGQDPNFDWLLVAVVFFLLNVGFVLFNVVSYEGIDKSDSSGQTEDVSIQDQKLLDTKVMQRIIKSFENNKAELDNLISKPVDVVDPSI